MEIEKPGNPGLAMLRELEGTALLVPTAHGGKGASPVEAIQIHRARGLNISFSIDFLIGQYYLDRTDLYQSIVCFRPSPNSTIG